VQWHQPIGYANLFPSCLFDKWKPGRTVRYAWLPSVRRNTKQSMRVTQTVAKTAISLMTWLHAWMRVSLRLGYILSFHRLIVPRLADWLNLTERHWMQASWCRNETRPPQVYCSIQHIRMQAYPEMITCSQKGFCFFLNFSSLYDLKNMWRDDSVEPLILARTQFRPTRVWFKFWSTATLHIFDVRVQGQIYHKMSSWRHTQTDAQTPLK